ncbi:MAG: hypothetical protein V2A79_12865 [Planctomycetota bacterium]
MKESRILAVDHVELQTYAGSEERLSWFYSEVIGLEVVEEPPQRPACLRFRSADLELRYLLLPEPVIEANAHRATLLVNSLREARKLLDEARVPYTPITGIAYTDRHLSLLDPGGNRVAIRQAWRWLT